MMAMKVFSRRKLIARNLPTVPFMARVLGTRVTASELYDRRLGNNNNASALSPRFSEVDEDEGLGRSVPLFAVALQKFEKKLIAHSEGGIGTKLNSETNIINSVNEFLVYANPCDVGRLGMSRFPTRLFSASPGDGDGGDDDDDDDDGPLSKQERKDVEEEEYWRRIAEKEAAKEAVEEKYAIFQIMYFMSDLSSREPAQVTSGDMARQLHARAHTSGILDFYGSASLKIRVGIPRLYRFWIEGNPKDPRSIPPTNFEKHFKTPDPTKY